MFPETSMARHQDLIMSCMDELVQKVSESRRICKALHSLGLLPEDKYRATLACSKSQDRMKHIFHALSTKGQQGQEALYRLLQEYEPELTLQMEHSVYVHMMKQRLIQSVMQVEPVANRMLHIGLFTEEDYFEVCDQEGSEARMRAMFRVLDQYGAEHRDGFYKALFYCEPLLYRELEKHRVLQMYELGKEHNQLVNKNQEHHKLEERLRELEYKEKQLEKEKQDLRKMWELLENQKAEMEEERKKVAEMKQELEKIQRNRDEENLNSSFLTGRDGQRITGQSEHLDNNGFAIPVNANSILDRILD